mmetsp:Transcript_13990/g.17713  ORF Transcript_13990/g.17713 Transcript_13990/m.17713 type:complete len:292 (-) Transcript_13990:31-906(-)
MARHEIRHHEVYDSIGVTLGLVLEVETFVHLLDADGLLVSSMAQNQLLQKHERPLVGHALSHLDLSLPSMRRVGLLTVITLQVLNDELNLEGLLEERVCLHLFLHSQFDFNTTRVRLCPDEGRVEQFDSFETLDVLEAKSEKLGALELSKRPRRSLIAITIAAMVQHELLRDAFGDIDLTFEAVNASVCSVRLSHDATDAAADKAGLKNRLVDDFTGDVRRSRAHISLLALRVVEAHSVIDGSAIICRLLVDSWLKEHVVCLVFFSINFHFCRVGWSICSIQIVIFIFIAI